MEKKINTKKKNNLFIAYSNLPNLNPYYITGFTEAEGCFYFKIEKTSTAKIGLRFIPIFYLTQDNNSESVLKNIHETLCSLYKPFTCSFVKRVKDNTVNYTVRGITACKNIIQHFNHYPLQGEKQRNFLIFCEIIKLLEKKQLKQDGLKILKKIFEMNSQGLLRRKNINDWLNLSHKKTEKKLSDLICMNSVQEEESENIKYMDTTNSPKTLNPWYITGLIDGDGSFYLSFSKPPKLRLRFGFSLVALHTNNQILNLMEKYFLCGQIYSIKQKQKNYLRFQVENIQELEHKIIPHFKIYPLQTYKKNHYNIFCETLLIHKASLSNPPALFLAAQEKYKWLNYLLYIEKAYDMNLKGKHREYKKQDMLEWVQDYIKKMH